MSNFNETRRSSKPSPSAALSARTIRTLADDLYRSLRQDGCQPRDIVTVSTRLLELVTDTLRLDAAGPERPRG